MTSPRSKPPRLREGSVVAVISPSSGGPHAYPRVFEKGLEVLREDLGLEVLEMPHVRAPQSYLRRNPQARAEDINAAFQDNAVAAIFASIGGDDSVRALPFVDMKAIMKRPKILMGFSDTTTLLTYLSLRGMVTFYGPSVMAGFAQMRNYPSQMAHLREMLFDPPDIYEYRPFSRHSEGYPDWSVDGNAGLVTSRKRSRGWKRLQGREVVEGELFGGCTEVLEMMKGTRFFPPPDFWRNKVLFLETSEQALSPDSVKCILRNYGMMGTLDDLSALLLGRPRGYTAAERREMEKGVREVVGSEFGRPDLPVIANMDFGHTDPQMVLPLGARVRIDPCGPSMTLLEPAVE